MAEAGVYAGQVDSPVREGDACRDPGFRREELDIGRERGGDVAVAGGEAEGERKRDQGRHRASFGSQDLNFVFCVFSFLNSNFRMSVKYV